MGYRYNDDGAGKWNLELGDLDPALSLLDDEAHVGVENVEIALPCFEDPRGEGSILRRGVPARRLNGELVTTVFDLKLAQYGVGREGLPGVWPSGYDDPTVPYTPAWQEPITADSAEVRTRTAQE